MKKLIFILAIFSLLMPLNGQKQNHEYILARSYMVKNDYNSALLHFNTYIKDNKGNINALYFRGITYFELKRYDKAIADFLLVNARQRGRAGFMLAKAESRLNHPEIAVKYLSEHLSSSYKLPEKVILLDEDLTNLENTGAWKALWKEKEWYNPMDIKLQEAVYLMSNEKHLDALNILGELEKTGYNKSLVHFKKAEIYSNTGNIKAAYKALDEAIKLNNRNSEALKLRVRLFSTDGKPEEALVDCKNLLRLAPDEFEYYLTLGSIYSKLGYYDEAVNNHEIYIGLFPDSAKAFHSMGMVHYDNKKYLRAISSYNSALELDMSQSSYYLARGKAYAATKTYKYAERDYSMALDLDPLNSETWFAKGLVDMELGNRETACFDFKKALQYGNYDSREYIDRLCK